ncbi:MAG: S4 domain-containing protein, partial [Thermodesulfobacteriota bacterium]
MDKTLPETDCPKIELKCDIDGFRLDNFILQNLAHSLYSRSGLKKEINLGRVRVDGKQITKAGFRLRPGQVVCFYPQPAQENIEPVKRDLEIIYSDDALV